MRQICLVASSMLAVAVATSASGQTAEPSRLEERRARDPQSAQLQPIGTTLGPLRVFPRIEAGLLYDDNVFASDTGELDDVTFRLEPSVDLAGEFGIYRLNVAADLEHVEFAQFEDESRTNLHLDSDFAAEIVRDLNARLHLNYDIDHEDRGDPNSLRSSVEPVKLEELDFGGEIERRARRLLAGLEAAIRSLDFNNVPRIDGTIENNNDRDRDFVLVGGKLGYEFSPGYSLLLRGNYDQVDFERPVDDFGFDRDSKTWRVTGGLTFELARLLIGDVFVGYIDRDYDDVRFKAIKEPLIGAGLTWSPTGLTDVRVTASRTIEETIFGGFQAYVFTNVGVRVEHELTRQIVLSAGLRYGKFDFVRNRVSVDPPRDDDNVGISTGVRYALNQRFYARAGYEWAHRSSTAAASDYSRNRLQAAVGFQF